MAKVKFGVLVVGGTNIKSLLNINSTQIEYFYNKKINNGSFIRIVDNQIRYFDDYDIEYNSKTVIFAQISKNLDYLYFYFPKSNFTIKIEENGIENEIKATGIRALISSEPNLDHSEDDIIKETDNSNQNNNKKIRIL